MHRLLMPPARQIMPTMRLPRVQEPNGVVARNLQDTLMDRDALRRLRTTGGGSRTLTGPMPIPLQTYVTPDGGTNTTPSMAEGAVKMNARRLVNKTPGNARA